MNWFKEVKVDMKEIGVNEEKIKNEEDQGGKLKHLSE